MSTTLTLGGRSPLSGSLGCVQPCCIRLIVGGAFPHSTTEASGRRFAWLSSQNSLPGWAEPVSSTERSRGRFSGSSIALRAVRVALLGRRPGCDLVSGRVESGRPFDSCVADTGLSGGLVDRAKEHVLDDRESHR